MLGLDNSRQVETEGSRVRFGCIDVEEPMTSDGDRAILVIGGLL